MRPQGAHDCHRRSSAGKQRVWAHPHAHTQHASTCESLHGLHQSIRASGVVHAITQRTALLTSARHCAGVGDCQDSVSTHLRWSVCWQRVWPKLWHQKCFWCTRNHFARLVLHQWLVRELALKLYFKILPHCFCVLNFYESEYYSGKCCHTTGTLLVPGRSFTKEASPRTRITHGHGHRRRPTQAQGCTIRRLHRKRRITANPPLLHGKISNSNHVRWTSYPNQ